jgi:hypothetical protein
MLGLVIAAVVFASYSAQAAPLEINAVSVDGGGTGSGPGSTRGISFLVNTPLAISSVGLFSDIGSTSYDVKIYASPDGHSLGALLASTTATTGGGGLQWYDIPIGFGFAAGNYYAIGWGTTSGGIIPGGVGAYFHYGSDAHLPLTTGPVTLIDGFVNVGDFTNGLHPQLRVDVNQVPEPGTLLLIGAGLSLVAVRRRLFART